MEIEVGVQPNCSECALVIFSDKLKKKQLEFINKWIKDKKLNPIKTPKGNISIETGSSEGLNDKEDLWNLRDSLEELSKFLKLFIYEDDQYRLVRDDSYYDAIEERAI